MDSVKLRTGNRCGKGFDAEDDEMGLWRFTE